MDNVDWAKTTMDFQNPAGTSFSFTKSVDNTTGEFNNLQVVSDPAPGGVTLTSLTVDFTPDDASGGGTSATLVTTRVASAGTANDQSVDFNAEGTAGYTIKAQNLTSSGLGLATDAAQNDWMDRADVERAASAVETAMRRARDASQTLSVGISIVTTREDFTKEFSDVLLEGAAKLTQADQNEEGATLLMLQTRQQLGVTSLSLANQSQQSILRLFG